MNNDEQTIARMLSSRPWFTNGRYPWEIYKTSLLSTFLNGGILRRRNYKERLPASETIEIAKKQLRNTSFSIIRNNCEHFATFCVTGKKKSRQVRKILYGLTSATAGIALLALSRIFKHR